MRLHQFTTYGLESFREFLGVEDRNTRPVPVDLLDRSIVATPYSPEVVLEELNFATRYELADYLIAKLEPALRPEDWTNTHIWSWLALFYFDQLAPTSSGVRKIGDPARYVLSLEHQRRYRHLVEFPVALVRNHGKFAAPFLSLPLHVHGDMIEQLFSRIEVIRSRALVLTAARLYYGKGHALKPGATSREKGGNVRRFYKLYQQLSLTYDLAGMSPDTILAMLPSEFDRFLTGEVL